MRVVTPEQMRALDGRAIRDVGLPSVVLMDRAGSAVARVAASYATAPRAVVVAGPGNNGGDGYVAARCLADGGFATRVFSLAPPEKLTPDARTFYRCYLEAGGVVAPFQRRSLAREAANAGVVVDALLGTGARGGLEGPYAEAARIINRAAAPVIAVDVPSGLDAARSELPRLVVKATATVTFGLPKIGLLQYPARSAVGDLYVVDIGFPRAIMAALPFAPEGRGYGYVAYVPSTSEITSALTGLAPDAHKGTAGRCFLLAGSRGMTGAAILAARASLRAGAGLTTAALPVSQEPVFKAAVAESLSMPLDETADGAAAARAWRDVRKGMEGADACAVGPGLGAHVETRELLLRSLRGYRGPVVIDADGLNLLGADTIRELKLRGVITPHPGEAARLLGVDVATVQGDRLAAARALAEKTGMTVVLKGYLSVIVSAREPTVLNPTGNAGLASGGTGDVLTGVIAALLARGLTPRDAAVAGAYVHGYAGDLAAERLGPRSVTAGDVVGALPLAFNNLARGSYGEDVGYSRLWKLGEEREGLWGGKACYG